ncbi:MAG: InlB B-repeat-containing protein [Coriobacteriales bacterium]|nr:InlB B-repeat-containing protein [Coriobacteriales bacterium]
MNTKKASFSIVKRLPAATLSLILALALVPPTTFALPKSDPVVQGNAAPEALQVASMETGELLHATSDTQGVAAEAMADSELSEAELSEAEPSESENAASESEQASNSAADVLETEQVEQDSQPNDYQDSDDASQAAESTEALLDEDDDEPITPLAASVTDESSLRAAITAAPSGTSETVTLENDISLTGTALNIPADKDIVLEGGYLLIGVSGVSTIVVNGKLTLDGITVTHNAGATGRGVTVASGGSLYLESGAISGNTAAPNPNWNGGGVDNSGTFVMTGGSITNNHVLAGGSGGGVHNDAAGTFTLKGGKISNNTAAGDISNPSDPRGGFGGGVWNQGSFSMQDGEIVLNEAFEGGGIYSTTAFTMSGGLVSKNSANSGLAGRGSIGGGILIRDAFTMTGGVVSYNDAASGGGGVYSYDKGNFTLINGDIIYNTADQRGGGVYNGAGMTFTMQGGSISNNTSNVAAGGLANNVGAVFTMSGGTIADNTAVSAGGGIYNYADATAGATITMTGGSITGNTATSQGGGIYNQGAGSAGASISMSGGVISFNTATNAGGGGVMNTGAFEMSGGSIQNNETNGRGGGVTNVSTTSFAAHFEMSGNASVTGNSAGTMGGGVYHEGDISVFTFADGEINGNNADTNGGGIYLASSASFTMEAGLVSVNTAQNGGGVYSAGTFDMQGGDILDNTAQNGGGVYTNNTFTMSGGNIAHNKADKPASTPTAPDGGGAGGGVYNSGTFTMTGGRIANNAVPLNVRMNFWDSSLSRGGGIYNSGTLTLSDDATLSNNYAVRGAGIYNDEILTMQGGAILGLYDGDQRIPNSYQYAGGGVYNNSGATFSMAGGRISGQSGNGEGPPHTGAGVYNVGAFDMSAGTIGGYTLEDANEVSFGGGGGVANVYGGVFAMHGTAVIVGNAGDAEAGGSAGVFNYAATFDLYEDALITHNYGHGVVNTGDQDAAGLFTMKDNAVISDHKPDSEYFPSEGGGVTNGYYGTFIMDGGTITDNEKANQGGGVYNFGEEAYFTMNGGSLTNNTADFGGALYNGENASFTLNDGEIAGNSAASIGGGIGSEAAVLFEIKGGTVANNTAIYGGGIYLENGQPLSVFGGEISNNTAEVDGGGIWIDYSYLDQLSVSAGVVFSNNLAQASYERDPIDDATYMAQIGNNGSGVTWTVPLLQGYNNYDINYQSDYQSFVIHYDSNGGTGIMDDQRAVYASDLTLIKNAFTRTGYSFAGWALSSDGSVEYADEYSFTPFDLGEDITLYAVWTPTTTIEPEDAAKYTVYYYNEQTGALLGTSPYEYFDIIGSLAEAVVQTFTGYAFNPNNPNNVRSGIIVEDGSLVLKLYYTPTSEEPVVDDPNGSGPETGDPDDGVEADDPDDDEATVPAKTPKTGDSGALFSLMTFLLWSAGLLFMMRLLIWCHSRRAYYRQPRREKD